MRCASEEEKAERKKEIKAIDQFRRDETAKITQKILDDLKGQPVRLLGKDRYAGEIAFKDEALRDEIFKTLSAPKGWRFSRMEDGGGIAF
jgi:acyl-CoA synthetase (NDP forming)